MRPVRFLRGVGALFALAIALAACQRVEPPSAVPMVVVPAVSHADFAGADAPSDLRALAEWAVASGDHGARPFAVVDKKTARLYVFNAAGHLLGASPVLIGFAPGDETVPGIGSKAIQDIRPEERTTPAGRFVTVPGRNAHGKSVVWIDYDAGVSMHAVITDVPSERRLERLASPDPKEHRISWGCINVPTAFFNDVAFPTLGERGVVVYIVPDTQPLESFFPGAATREARAEPSLQRLMK